MKEFRCGPVWDERIVKLNPAKKIGVLMSSGADSTTLFKLLWDNFPETEIRIFNVQTSWDPKKPLIEEILEKLGVDLELEIIGEKYHNWEMKNHFARLMLAFQDVRNDEDIEELYCGNILPPHPQWFPRWNVDQKGMAKRPWLTNDKFWKNPFEHVEKYHVIDLGRRNGFDDIYNTTISCNTHATEPCGYCMGCRELEYAYDQLDNEEGLSLDKCAKIAVNIYGDIGW